jgi:hypothetical protein
MGIDKVNPGDRIPGIPASTWNDFVSVANAYRSGQLLTTAAFQAAGSSFGIIPVKNTTASDRSQFDILALNGIVYTPTDNLSGFKTAPILKGEAPGTPPQKFVILQEPIKAGKIGRGMILGTTAVQIDMIDTGDEYADVISGDSTKLRSNPFGASRILYHEGTTGTKWAIVAHGLLTPMFAIGKTNASHAKGASGTINIYRGTTKGSETFASSVTITAWNRFSDVASGKWVLAMYLQGGWDLVAAECA